ncbi:hypothetical protein GGF40_002513 [Coemansia sp. RSA 1286]|nr:hypothetical protein GGF40_002513 [Coemansia sp. RSA 1286]
MFCVGMLLPAQYAVAGPAAGLFHPPMPGGSVDAASSNADGLGRRASAMKCNGYSELCDRKYDKVAYVTTHNSFATGDNIAANQNKEIQQQLDDGVRALMLDIHDPSSTSFSRKRSGPQDGHEDIVDSPGYNNDTSALVKRDGPVPTLCHSVCMLLNKGPIVDQLKHVKTFLDENPYEVVTVFIENASKFTDEEMAAPFQDAGLVDYAHAPNATYDEGYQWPTLGEMISKNKRLVVLASTVTDTETYPWLLYDRNYAVQTSYSVKAGQAFDCNPISKVRSLLIMNHFVSVEETTGLLSFDKPDYASSLKVNNLQSFIDQASLCGKDGHFPNYVTVDFFDAGDVLLAVANINKVTFTNTTTNTFGNVSSDSKSDSSDNSSSTHSAAVSINLGSSQALVAGLLSIVAGTLVLGF